MHMCLIIIIKILTLFFALTAQSFNARILILFVNLEI